MTDELTPHRIALATALASLAIVTVPLPGATLADLASERTAAVDTTEARAELQARLDSLQVQLRTAPGDRVPMLRRQVETVRRRLAEGDFRPGDVVRIRVRGDTLSGEYSVTPERTLELQDVVTVPVDNMLYDELQPVVRDSLATYLRDAATIDVQPMIRVGVLGSVGTPGFYDLQPSASVADALMAAGGPTQEADLEELEVRLGQDQRLAFPEENVDLATLQDLGVHRGDRFFVPTRTGGFGFGSVVAALGALSTVIFAVTRF